MANSKTRRIIEIDVTTSKGAQQGIRQINSQLRSMEGAAKKTQREVKRMSTQFNVMTVAAQAFIALRLVQHVTGMADSMILLSARVNLVAESTVGTTKAMEDLFAVSLQTRSAIEASAGLYARLGLATQQLGTSHEDLIKAVQTTANSLVLSGAGAQEAKASMIQLSQAFAKGKLDGDEFRTMTENNVFMFDLLARGLGKTRKELYAMSKAGELTSETVLSVLVDNAEEVQKKMDAIPLTFGHVATQVSNAFAKMALDAQGSIKVLTDALTSVPPFILGIKNSVQEQFAFLAAINQGDVSPWKLLTADQDEISRIMFNLNQKFRDAAAGVTEFRTQLEALDGPTDKLREALRGYDSHLQRLESIPVNERSEIVFAEIDRYNLLIKNSSDRLRELLILRGKLQQQINQGLGGPTGLEGNGEAPPPEPVVKDAERIYSEYEKTVLKANEASEILLDSFSELNALYQEGAINGDVYAKESEKLEKALLGTADAADKARGASYELGVALGQTLSQGVNDMGDALFDYMIGLETSFKQTIENIIEDIGRLIVKITLLNALKSGLSGTSAGSFLFPSADGNVFSQGSIVPFATGGVIDSPVLFPMANGTGLMGEAGPEAILPLKRGPDGKLGVTAEGGGAAKNVTVSIENKGSSDSEVVRSTATTDVNGTVVNIILDDIRRGGPLSNSFKALR